MSTSQYKLLSVSKWGSSDEYYIEKMRLDRKRGPVIEFTINVKTAHRYNALDDSDLYEHRRILTMLGMSVRITQPLSLDLIDC